MILSRERVSLRIIVGDITDFEGEAIVNPANTLMLMGGGVAGAIKRRGGEEIEIEARRNAPTPIGEAVVTSAGRLKCKYVIHAPTVETPGSPSNPENIYKATLAALRVARARGIRSIAFPLMGAGVGGVSPERAIESMSRAFLEAGSDLDLYLFLRDESTRDTVIKTLRTLGWVERT
ncbi:MAG: macro domain-containing protein [Sulfolobales archaeon]